MALYLSLVASLTVFQEVYLTYILLILSYWCLGYIAFLCENTFELNVQVLTYHYIILLNSFFWILSLISWSLTNNWFQMKLWKSFRFFSCLVHSILYEISVFQFPIMVYSFLAVIPWRCWLLKCHLFPPDCASEGLMLFAIFY